MKIQKQYLDSPPGEVKITHVDISKAKKEINYNIQINFEDRIKETIKWCKYSINLEKLKRKI